MTHRLRAACAALALIAGAALAQPTTSATAVDRRMVWDLTRLYPTDAAWDT